MIKTCIGTCFDGHNKAYIYIWISKKEQIVYVGMTNSFSGSLGRAGAHFGSTGTLRTRFLERKGYYINSTDDLIMYSFQLPSKPIFTNSEKSYREAIEYLIQKELLLKRTTVIPSFDVISWVRPSPRTSNLEVKSIANNITNTFLSEYPLI